MHRFDARISAHGAIDACRHAIACFGALKGLDHILDIPTWTKPAINGVVVGAIAMAIIGFTCGGWVTGGTARKNSATETSSGIAAALTPYCVEKSKSDPLGAAVLVELKAAGPYSRSGIVEKAGWATPLGADKPNTALAKSCELEITKTL
ncbi:hypothetical protein [Rhizobium herbae]